ncbi:MAG: hypothetical protein ACQERN_12110 [Thermodesulfobacteriota bacterium]
MAFRKQAMMPLVVLVVCGFILSTAGCGYMKNVRDDFLDIGTFAVGGAVPSTPPAEDAEAAGHILPIGIYAQATDIFHLGAIQKSTWDLEWDRRGLSVTEDVRAKYSFGPGHFVRIDQAPVAANVYKMEGNDVDGWRDYMRQWEGPISGAPAKELIFRQESGFMPYLYKGWRDWDGISLEVAISDPFVLHSGVYARAGVHPAQVVDFALSLFCLDFIYHDNAYHLDGTPRF